MATFELWPLADSDFYQLVNGHGHSPILKFRTQRMAMAIHQMFKFRIDEWPILLILERPNNFNYIFICEENKASYEDRSGVKLGLKFPHQFLLISVNHFTGKTIFY